MSFSKKATPFSDTTMSSDAVEAQHPSHREELPLLGTRLYRFNENQSGLVKGAITARLHLTKHQSSSYMDNSVLRPVTSPSWPRCSTVIDLDLLSYLFQFLDEIVVI